MKAFIYSLSDPRTGEIRYVGKTCDLKRRYGDHLGSRYQNHAGHWLRSLRKLGLRPVMDVLEEFSDHECDYDSSERFHIAYFRFLGMRLTNQESGGESGKLHSVETKRAMSLKAKGRPFSKLAKERALAARRTPEGRANIAAAKRGMKRSPEAIEKHRAKMMGHAVSEDTRRKLSKANKGKKPSTLAIQRTKETAPFRTYSVETRAKLATFKGRHHTPEAKAAIGEKNRGRKRTPEEVEANRQRAIEWNKSNPHHGWTPEEREQIAERTRQQHARRRAAIMASEMKGGSLRSRTKRESLVA